MREIQVSEITKTVRQMCMDAAYHLPKDIYEGLKKGRETEESPVGCIVLDQIIKNAEIADAEDRPYCQDTGMTLVFVEVGQDVHFVGGDLKEAINEGVAQGYVEGYLRKSVVAEPLFNRKNTQNNTPAIIYIDIVPGDKVEINVELKGFGSENKSDVAMLVPADGVEGVKNAVLEIVNMLALTHALQSYLALVLVVLWTKQLLCPKKLCFAILALLTKILSMQNWKKKFWKWLTKLVSVHNWAAQQLVSV